MAPIITLSGQRNLTSAVPVFVLLLTRPQAKVEVRSYAHVELIKCVEIRLLLIG